jgi:hypothetical protein
MKTLPPVRISAASYDALVAQTRAVLAACRHEADDGTPVYFPDGSGHYAALWTRDFCYMVEGAAQLIPPEEILAGIDYLLAGQREDGTLPERVQADGTPIYFPGPVDQPLGSQPAVDNQFLMVKLICAYAGVTRDYTGSRQRLERMWSAIDAVEVAPDGLIAVDRNLPWVAYGFTDTVAQTGKVLFASLLHWEACELMAQTYKAWEEHDDAHTWFERATHAGHRLFEFFDEDQGLCRAAMRDCRQPDIWGTAYAAVLRVASKTQTERIAHTFLRHRQGIILSGYVRHLLGGEHWQRLLVEVPPGTYQNGGFWAVPSGWVARTIATVDESYARRMMEALIAQFGRDGACEWINPEQQAVPGYAASVACVLGSVTRSKG